MSKVLFATVAMVGMLACSSGQQSIDLPPQQAGGLPGAGGKQPTYGAGLDASLTALIPQTAIQLVDATAALTYAFTYLSATPSGPLTVVGGTATVNLTALPSGQAGDMTLQVLQNGTPKLSGATQGVILKSGTNDVTINLALLGAGTGTGTGTGTGLNNANLVLHVNVATGTDTGTATATSSLGGVRFADIQPLAVKYCGGAGCHASANNDATQEAFWTKAGKATLISYLTGNGAEKMPKGSLANVITGAEQTQLINYANTLQ